LRSLSPIKTHTAIPNEHIAEKSSCLDARCIILALTIAVYKHQIAMAFQGNRGQSPVFAAAFAAGPALPPACVRVCDSRYGSIHAYPGTYVAPAPTELGVAGDRSIVIPRAASAE